MNKLLGNIESITQKSNKPPKFNALNMPKLNFYCVDGKDEKNQLHQSNNEIKQNLFVQDNFNIHQKLNENEITENLNKNINGKNVFDDKTSHVIQSSEIQSNNPVSIIKTVDLKSHKEIFENMSQNNFNEPPGENDCNNLNEIAFLREKNSSLMKEVSKFKMSQFKHEKDIEIRIIIHKKENKQFDLYNEEIRELRESKTELKLRFSNINEEAHQIEIQKLNNKLSIKDREIDLLDKQNIALKDKLCGLENFIRNFIEESAKYRKDVDVNVLIYLI